MKRTISQLTENIDSYSALSAPLSIDPILDGGIKKDILETLNNKASSKPHLHLFEVPSETAPDNSDGENDDYFILVASPCILFKKNAGIWSLIEKTNDMFFYADDSGIRKYYAFSDDLVETILIHQIDFADPSGGAVKFTPQILTTLQQDQARININAASKEYIDNTIAALKNGGAIGASVAGSTMAWYGPVSTIPQDWAKIDSTPTWFSKTEYAQLYRALGGESNPFGLTANTFSIPWCPEGTSIVSAGANFHVGTNGGEQKHTLTMPEIPEHRFSTIAPIGRGNQDTLINSDANKHIATEATGNVQDDDNNAYKLYAAPDGYEPTLGKTNSLGGGLAHNNMPPYSPAYIIIKLKNTGGNFTASINEKGHLILTFDDGSVQDAGNFSVQNPYYALPTVTAIGNTTIPVEKAIFIKEINIFVVDGNPTVNILDLNTGDMTEQSVYETVANIKKNVGENITVNISGGTIKIQIVTYNI